MKGTEQFKEKRNVLGNSLFVFVRENLKDSFTSSQRHQIKLSIVYYILFEKVKYYPKREPLRLHFISLQRLSH